jgi:3-phosphoshikimate 1-carboxyvinyltransferase
MKVTIRPSQQGVSSSSKKSGGSLALPPDKSILHRLLIIGSLTETQFTIPIPSLSAISHDVFATVLALESLGVPIELFADHIDLQGVGFRGLRAPSHKINCANSGTTARLLLGLLCGQSFDATLTGDRSLSTRPMLRLADLLNQSLGANILTTQEGTLPAEIRGGRLHSADVRLPVSSAQMKSAVLLAGLHTEGVTTVTSPHESRDHTERMLAAFGCEIGDDAGVISIRGGSSFSLPDEVVYLVPGDLSNAAFLIVAALVLGRDVTLKKVSLNHSRTRFLEILTVMGVKFSISELVEEWGEESGTISLLSQDLNTLVPFQIAGEDVALVIDEIPVLAVLAAFVNGISTIRNAEELRVKESDRIHRLHLQLDRFGIENEEYQDGLSISGKIDQAINPAEVDHDGDHRLAMAFSIIALRATEQIVITEAECCKISFPNFFDELQTLCGEDRLTIVRDIPNELEREP